MAVLARGCAMAGAISPIIASPSPTPHLDPLSRLPVESPSMQPTHGAAGSPPTAAAFDRGQIDALKAEFHRLFGEQPPAGSLPAPNRRTRVVRAPGRVNLIGEHTDYNDGFVFPMAIEPCVLLACRSRDDGAVRLASTAFPGEVVEFSVQAKVTRGEPSWANYSRGVAAELLG